MFQVRLSIRILLLYNSDYGDGTAPKQGEAARAGVLRTARAVEAALRRLPDAEVVPLALDSPASDSYA